MELESSTGLFISTSLHTRVTVESQTETRRTANTVQCFNYWPWFLKTFQIKTQGEEIDFENHSAEMGKTCLEVAIKCCVSKQFYQWERMHDTWSHSQWRDFTFTAIRWRAGALKRVIWPRLRVWVRAWLGEGKEGGGWRSSGQVRACW